MSQAQQRARDTAQPDGDPAPSILATVLVWPDQISTVLQALGDLYEAAWAHEPGLLTIALEARAAYHDGYLPDAGTIELRLRARDRQQDAAAVRPLAAQAEAPEVLPARLALLSENLRRHSAALAAGYIQDALAAGTPADIVLRNADRMLARSASAGVVTRTGSFIAPKCKEIYVNGIGKGNITGVPTGLYTLDYETGGLPFGEMSILAARTGQGKSSLAGCITIAATAQKLPVLIIGHEMTAELYLKRMACALGGIAFKAADRSMLSPSYKEKYFAALDDLERRPITIIDAAITPTQAVAAVASWGSTHPRGLVIVDYIQLETLPGFTGPRHDELSALSHLWMACFKRANLAGLVLSQLRRDGEGEPELAELLGSGTMSQDAYMVALLWRPSKDRKPAETSAANLAWLNLAKHRNGSLVRCPLHFQGYCMAFRDWDTKADRRLTTEDELVTYEQAITGDHWAP